LVIAGASANAYGPLLCIFTPYENADRELPAVPFIGYYYLEFP
jgi:hypothetical protein